MANRRFNGLEYLLAGRYRRKREAQDVAKGYRNRGVVRYVRVVQIKSKSGTKYDVWVR